MRQLAPLVVDDANLDAGKNRPRGDIAADMLLRAPIDSVLLGSDGFSVELRGIGELPFTAVSEIRNEPAAAAAAAEATTN